MKLEEVQKILKAELASDYDFKDREVKTCYASDLISDLLTFTDESPLLLTGLTNIQVMRTAELLDFVAICFVRGKKPLPETVNLAKEYGIPLYITRMLMYEASGRLFKAGLAPGSKKELNDRCRKTS
jgi:hypothetical protein